MNNSFTVIMINKICIITNYRIVLFITVTQVIYEKIKTFRGYYTVSYFLSILSQCQIKTSQFFRPELYFCSTPIITAITEIRFN